jgi:hypothetical protein
VCVGRGGDPLFAAAAHVQLVVCKFDLCIEQSTGSFRVGGGGGGATP